MTMVYEPWFDRGILHILHTFLGYMHPLLVRCLGFDWEVLDAGFPLVRQRHPHHPARVHGLGEGECVRVYCPPVVAGGGHLVVLDSGTLMHPLVTLWPPGCSELRASCYHPLRLGLM